MVAAEDSPRRPVDPRWLRLDQTLAELAAAVGGFDPDRWAEDRQYLGNDTRQALAAFRRRRRETLALRRRLSPAQWARGGLHPTRGRLTIGDFVVALAAHDGNHLARLGRALVGLP